MKKLLLCLLCANFLGIAAVNANEDEDKKPTSLSCDDCRRKICLVNDDSTDERPS